MFNCIQIDPTKSFLRLLFLHLWLFETHSYVLGRDARSGHICHYSYVLGRGTQKPKTSRNTALFCMFWKFQLFFYINLINLGHFSKMIIFDPEQTFFGVLEKFGRLLE